MAMYKFVGDKTSFKTFDVKDCFVEKTYLTNSPYEDGAIFTNLELKGVEVPVPIQTHFGGVQLTNRIVPAIVSHSCDGRTVAFTVRSLTRGIRVSEINGMPDFVSPNGSVNKLARELAKREMSDVEVLRAIIAKSRDAICIHVQWVDAVKPSGEHYPKRLIHVNFFK